MRFGPFTSPQEKHNSDFAIKNINLFVDRISPKKEFKFNALKNSKIDFEIIKKIYIKFELLTYSKMENESLSLQDEGEQSGDVIMSDNDIDPNYEPSEDGITI